jgi:hypothetical protein
MVADDDRILIVNNFCVYIAMNKATMKDTCTTMSCKAVRTGINENL